MSAPDDAPKSALKIPPAQGAVTHVAQIGFGDSFCESSVIAGGHEQTDTADLQDPELAHLQKARKRRGSLTIWFDPAMIREAAPTGKRG